MAFHPCCGGSLKTGVKVIAGIQIVLNSIAFVLISLAIVLYACSQLFVYQRTLGPVDELEANEIAPNDGFYAKPYIVQGQQMYINLEYLKHQMPKIMVISLILVLYPLLLALELWKGANQRNYWRCNVWFRFHVASFIISLTIAPFIYFLEVKSYSETQMSSDAQTAFKWLMALFSVVSLCISMYFIWVVHSFMKELRRDALPIYHQKQVAEKI